MLTKGEYKIVQKYSISHSLLSQSENEPNTTATNVDKVLLERNDENKIVYFIDKNSLGAGSIIEIVADTDMVLLNSCHYRIVKAEPVIHDMEFIKKLLDKKTSK